MDNKNEKLICNWCNRETTVIWVHGHGQCAICGTNIDECCRGEICDLPRDTDRIEKQGHNDK